MPSCSPGSPGCTCAASEALFSQLGCLFHVSAMRFHICSCYLVGYFQIFLRSACYFLVMLFHSCSFLFIVVMFVLFLVLSSYFVIPHNLLLFRFVFGLWGGSQAQLSSVTAHPHVSRVSLIHVSDSVVWLVLLRGSVLPLALLPMLHPRCSECF